MLTQESLLWTVGLVLAILTALLGFSGLFPPVIEQWLKVAAAILGVISVYLKGSPLPRKVWTDAERAAAGEGQ